MSDQYPFLNTIGVASIAGVNPFLLAQLNKLGQQLGRSVDVFSGYRSPGYSERVGGYANDPHSRGEAVDAQIGGTPIGQVVPLATLASLGLEGGNSPGFYPAGGSGGRDPEHVQIPGSGADKAMRSPSLGQATGNPASGNVPPPGLSTLPYTPGSAPPATEIPNYRPAGRGTSATPLQVIRDYAPRVGLDPAAVVAYALTQGGLYWGAVGDNGQSFGPFQMNIHGAAYGHANPAVWANTPQGMIDGMNMMAHAGASGLSGPEAAAYIVGPKFGNGADPPRDMAKARAVYPQAAEIVGQPGQAGVDAVVAGVSGASSGYSPAARPPAPATPPPPPQLPPYQGAPPPPPLHLLPDAGPPPPSAGAPAPYYHGKPPSPAEDFGVVKPGAAPLVPKGRPAAAAGAPIVPAAALRGPFRR
jgi:hypothetical protein